MTDAASDAAGLQSGIATRHGERAAWVEYFVAFVDVLLLK